MRSVVVHARVLACPGRRRCPTATGHQPCLLLTWPCIGHLLCRCMHVSCPSRRSAQLHRPCSSSAPSSTQGRCAHAVCCWPVARVRAAVLRYAHITASFHLLTHCTLACHGPAALDSVMQAACDGLRYVPQFLLTDAMMSCCTAGNLLSPQLERRGG